MLRSFVLGVCASLVSLPCLAADMDWRDLTPRLEGCWDGTGMGGQVSECWIVSDNGRADGMFLMRADAMQFSQILTIDDFGDGPEMRLKHVNADMTGWEEKDDYLTFRLTGTETDSLIFKGLTLMFDGDGARRTELTMSFGPDDVRLVPFVFVRSASLTKASD